MRTSEANGLGMYMCKKLQNLPPKAEIASCTNSVYFILQLRGCRKGMQGKDARADTDPFVRPPVRRNNL